MELASCYAVRDCVSTALAKYSLDDDVFAYIVQVAHDTVCTFRRKMELSSGSLSMSAYFRTVANLLDSYHSV